MPDDKMRMGGYSPKPEGPMEKTQTPATGSSEPAYDSVDVEKEAIRLGITHNPGHGQGGAGH